MLAQYRLEAGHDISTECPMATARRHVPPLSRRRSEPPGDAVDIANCGRASSGQAARRRVAGSAASDRPRVRLVDVGHVQPQSNTRKGFRLAMPRVGVLTNLHDALADLNLCVADAARRRLVSFQFLRTERRNVE